MRYFVWLSLFLFSFSVSAQETSTRVTIVGTVHYGNKKTNGDSLLNILFKIRPTIIFDEDVDIKKQPLHLRLAKTLGFVKYGIEYYSERNYLSRFPNTELIAIDLKFENRVKFAKSVTKIEKDLREKNNSLFASVSTPDYVKKAILEYVKPKNYAVFAVNDSSLFAMNQVNVVDSIRQFHRLYKERLLPIIHSYSGYFDIALRANEDFKIWERRNENMAEVILNRLQSVSADTPVVILCGLYHKYYLEDLLKPQQEKYNFKLYNYWELFKEQ